MNIIASEEYTKIKQKSTGITLVIAIILLSISFLWTFVETTDPPLFEVLSEASGTVDFGNWAEGSGDVNNFQPPSEQNQSSSTQNETPNASGRQEESTLSGEAEESEVIKPPVKENHTQNKTKNTQPKQDKPKENKDNTTSQPNNTQQNTQTNSNSNNTEGSNHGNSNQIGNRGRDDVKILDKDGLYSFGSGEEGLQGRKPISLPKPVYEVEAEAKITYEFTIAPDGSVKHVKALTLSSNAELKNAGIKAIYKWKFEPIEENKTQKTKVTITFKLK